MIQKKIEDYLQPVLEDMGYELWGCQYLTQGRHSLLRVYIDKPEGIGIEDCEQASYRISSLLDVENPISGNYSLEVSSPGIPRSLFYIEQYKRFVGEQVEVKLVKPVLGRRKFTGNILSADSEILKLQVDEEEQSFLFSDIVKAILISK
ncbi:MAG: ribosome maturation factor RimP [Legionellales bacterium RIFCSPHIGHO2_12_FULL_35_11]|nr:MAG: ribosome maturation factor RimP [Legionellales bacterium RIFCSPHIGHO2_12_FULL_35_11]